MPEKVGKRKAKYGFSRFLTSASGAVLGCWRGLRARTPPAAVRNARERAQIQMVLFTEMHIQKNEKKAGRGKNNGFCLDADKKVC